jgi:hypothetical protein
MSRVANRLVALSPGNSILKEYVNAALQLIFANRLIADCILKESDIAIKFVNLLVALSPGNSIIKECNIAINFTNLLVADRILKPW